MGSQGRTSGNVSDNHIKLSIEEGDNSPMLILDPIHHILVPSPFALHCMRGDSSRFT